MFTQLILLPLLATLALASPIARQSTTEGKRIRSISNPSLCVTVQNGYAAYGTNVALSGCGDETSFTEFQLFSAVGPQRGLIQLISDDRYCLDAGDEVNGGGITLQGCDDSIDSQIFTVGTTGTGSEPNLRLAVGSSESQCLDVEKDSTPVNAKPYGSVKDLQTWECHDADSPDAAQQYFELV
ncbi:uncharacterized protein IL334_000521 [Kwoniella shivajii]|uniref:Ricin B lectin domain-containing protein n=1 Tax=Kwoniella shivajii TaxID=564305 RepID=A0ABZ1CPW1_9TREE|nr:hypothetical protein IL334_000521 [Kwoniella shivajii]